MKSRVLKLSLAVALISAPMMAAAADEQGGFLTSAWQQVTTTVKVAIDYWTAMLAPPTAPVAATVVVKAPAPVVAAPPPVVAAPAPPSSPAVQELRAQPLYSTQAPSSSLQEVQSARDAVKATKVLNVAQPGRPGTSKLHKSKEGVPLANFKTYKLNKTIPLLDIGTENLISRQDFTVSNLHWGATEGAQFKKLPQPAPVTLAEIKPFMKPVLKQQGPRGMNVNLAGMNKPVTLEQVQKVTYTTREIQEFKEYSYKPLSEDQLKMIAAVILFENGGHCEMIMGLFQQLAAVENYKLEANFNLGACAAELKMHQAAFEILSKVVEGEDGEFAPRGLAILAKDLPAIYEKDFYNLVKSLKNAKALIHADQTDAINYRMAKGAYRAGDFKSSITHAELVSEKSELSDDARFLVGMNKFALGDKGGALKSLQDLWNSLEKRNVGNTNIRALTTLNLARIYFAHKKYDKALEHYMKMPKDHPLWVQALIEQGWTQIASNDYAGAIGNMYSLHSPYFKAVYQPESFVVRTIGYLNICQYGDAYKSLTWLEKDYRDWYGKTSNYLNKHGNSNDIYASVKNYIRGKSGSDVDGVPYQIWRDMAHHKDFLNVQTALNEDINEYKRIDGVNDKIKADKEKIHWHADQGKKRFDSVKAQIGRAKTDMNLAKNVEQMRNSLKLERELTISYRFQLSLLEQDRLGYAQFQSKARNHLDKESVALTSTAGEDLLTHAKTMDQEMSRVLENNEFLRYEVFSGSGENIRYQVAGGQVSGVNRIPAHIKPTKMMNWNFDGEFWEDEIGSYRSSLQNNCPSNGRRQAAEAAAHASSQARHTENDDN